MMLVKRLTLSAVVVLPGILLAVLAIGPLQDGIKIDSAIPVQKYLIRQSPLPKSLLLNAFAVLSATPAADGDAKIFAANAAIAAGAPPKSQMRTIVAGLSAEPANPRGWMLLADAWTSSNPSRAADALGQSLTLAPFDYWIAGARTQRAAKLWTQLNGYDQANAVRQALLLWEEPLLRPQIGSVLQSRDGVALLTRAFAGRADEMRHFNRWVAAQRRQRQDNP